MKVRVALVIDLGMSVVGVYSWRVFDRGSLTRLCGLASPRTVASAETPAGQLAVDGVTPCVRTTQDQGLSPDPVSVISSSELHFSL